MEMLEKTVTKSVYFLLNLTHLQQLFVLLSASTCDADLMTSRLSAQSHNFCHSCKACLDYVSQGTTEENPGCLAQNSGHPRHAHVSSKRGSKVFSKKKKTTPRNEVPSAT